MIEQQCATVYKRTGAYYLHSNSQASSGVWIATPPFLKIDGAEPPLRLGETIRAVLANSRLGVEHPKNWDEIEYPIPQMASVGSWALFMKSALCVSVRKTGTVLNMTPNRNMGPKLGFLPLSSTITVPGMASPNEIAQALEDAFSRCE